MTAFASTFATRRRAPRRCAPRCAPSWPSTTRWPPSARHVLDGLRPRLHPRGRRARLDRHDLAEAVWRRRAQPRTLRRAGGNAGRRRAGRRALDRRPPERPADPAPGTRSAARKFLPASCRGELAFCIGLCEPDSGSDLASLRTRADAHRGGWVLNGRKVWTTFAHLCDYMIALVRTSARRGRRGTGPVAVPGRPAARRASPSARSATWPARKLQRGHLRRRAAARRRAGRREGEGWEQVTAELAFERSGPGALLLRASRCWTAALDALRGRCVARRRRWAACVARLWTLRRCRWPSPACCRTARPGAPGGAGEGPGQRFEQELPGRACARCATRRHARGDAPHARLPDADRAPFSLRGGTREILRGIIARELGLR